MAVFLCIYCGHKVETRCMPKKCPNCGNNNSFKKE